MGHQADHVASPITNPRNVGHRTIGIERVASGNRITILIHITEGDLLILLNLYQRGFVAHLKVTLTVGDWAKNEFVDGL